MAEENKTENKNTNTQKPVEHKEEFTEQKVSTRTINLPLVILLGINFLVIIIAFFIIFFFNPYKVKKSVITEEKEFKVLESKKEEMIIGPIIALREFKVNLKDNREDAILRIGVEIEFYDMESLQNAEKFFISKIRDTMLAILSNKKIADLQDIKGKLILKNEIINSLNEFLNGKVKNIYFSKFLMQ